MRAAWACLMAVLLAFSTAQAQGVLGWANTDELALNEQESSQVSSKPLFTKRLGRVTYSTNKVCLNCGDFWDNNNYGANHVSKRIQNDFPTFLKNELYQSGIFPSDVKERITLNVTLKELQQNSSVGASAERKNPLTSGAVMTTQLAISYELIEDEKVVGSWLVHSRATSNSMAPSTRLGEAIDAAVKRNVRSLMLKMIADFDPEKAPTARQILLAIGSEVDNTRSVLGYLVYGTSVAVGAVGDGLLVVAQNSGAIAAGLNNVAASMPHVEAASRGSSVEQDRAKAALQADFNERISQQKADPNSDYNKDARAREKASADRQKAEAARTAQRDADRKASEQKNQTQAKNERDREAEQTKRKQEQERIEEERKLALEKAKREALIREQERLAAERAAKEKKAAEEAAKKAEKERLEREENDKKIAYLDAMRNGIKLYARRCPDGEGKHYVVGLRPRIRPEVVSCINVRYTAYCPGANVGVSGVVENFLGAGTDCFFGDTATISPKLSCEPKDARMVVDGVVGCYK